MKKLIRYLGDLLGDDKGEEVPLRQASKRTVRIGMDKNFRVGQVKYVSLQAKAILLDVMEYCNESVDNDNIYVSRYNLWIFFDHRWEKQLSLDLKGKYVVVGFYTQSFINYGERDSYSTVLTCRFFNTIDNEEDAINLSLELTDSRLFVDNPYLRLSSNKTNNNNLTTTI
jgi:hypothetical protein